MVVICHGISLVRVYALWYSLRARSEQEGHPLWMLGCHVQLFGAGKLQLPGTGLPLFQAVHFRVRIPSQFASVQKISQIV